MKQKSKSKAKASVAQLKEWLGRTKWRIQPPSERPAGRVPRPKRAQPVLAATDAAIRNAPRRMDGKRAQYRVRGVRNLVVRVQPGGSRSYHAITRAMGQTVGRWLGSCDKLSLEEAAIRAAIVALEAKLEEVRRRQRQARRTAQ